jgi:hypothetical protein
VIFTLLSRFPVNRPPIRLPRASPGSGRPRFEPGARGVAPVYHQTGARGVAPAYPPTGARGVAPVYHPTGAYPSGVPINAPPTPAAAVANVETDVSYARIMSALKAAPPPPPPPPPPETGSEADSPYFPSDPSSGRLPYVPPTAMRKTAEAKKMYQFKIFA